MSLSKTKTKGTLKIVCERLKSCFVEIVLLSVILISSWLMSNMVAYGFIQVGAVSNLLSDRVVESNVTDNS